MSMNVQNLTYLSSITRRFMPAYGRQHPPRNSYRPYAVTFEKPSTLAALSNIRRMIAQDIDHSMRYHNERKPGEPLAYELLILNLLLPEDAGTETVVMNEVQHRQLVSYLQHNLYELIRRKPSPLPAVPPGRLFAELRNVLRTVQAYTSIVDLWN